MSTEKSKQTEPPGPQLDTQTKMWLLLDEMVVRLGRIEQVERSQIPIGKLESATIVLSPGETPIDLSTAPKYQLKGPWVSVTVTNDGSSNVSVNVNDGATAAVVKPSETRTIDMKARGKIKQLKFTVTAQTTVRFDGVM